MTFVLLIGMALCTRGIGRIAAANDWLHPVALAGYGLGILAFVVFYVGMTQRKLWFISDEKQAIYALLIIIVMKFLLGIGYTVLKGLR